MLQSGNITGYDRKSIHTVVEHSTFIRIGTNEKNLPVCPRMWYNIREEFRRYAMEILFLGTRAADYGPGCFAGMEDRFDRDNRRATSTLLNGRILLDAGAHVLDSLRIAGADLSAITDIIITHFHSDHFNAKNIETIANANRQAERQEPLRLWISAAAWRKAQEDPSSVPAAVAGLPRMEGVKICPMELMETYEVCKDFLVTGLPANHDPKYFPQHLLIEEETGEKRQKIFYGMDGGWMLRDTFYKIRGQKLDLMILDCTVGDYLGDYRMSDHNSIPMIRVMLPSLRTVEAIDDHTVVYIDHLAVTLHRSHEETVRICREDGIHVAYDGLRISGPDYLPENE